MSPHLPKGINRIHVLILAIYCSHDESSAWRLLPGQSVISVSCSHLSLTMSKGKGLDFLMVKNNTVQFNFHQPAARVGSQVAPGKCLMPKSGSVPFTKGQWKNQWKRIRLLQKKFSEAGFVVFWEFLKVSVIFFPFLDTVLIPMNTYNTLKRNAKQMVTISFFLNCVISICTVKFLIQDWIEKLPHPPLESLRMTLWFCLQRHFRVGFGNTRIFCKSFQNPRHWCHTGYELAPTKAWFKLKARRENKRRRFIKERREREEGRLGLR